MARPILERIDATDVTSVRSSAGESVGPLLSELGDRVHLPGTPGYRASLDRVFFPDASRRHPPCVVHPHTADDVAATLRIANANGGRVTVRGGGLSSNCVSDDSVMWTYRFTSPRRNRRATG